MSARAAHPKHRRRAQQGKRPTERQKRLRMHQRRRTAAENARRMDKAAKIFKRLGAGREVKVVR